MFVAPIIYVLPYGKWRGGGCHYYQVHVIMYIMSAREVLPASFAVKEGSVCGSE